MLIRLVLVCLTLASGESTIYSSFWAPLFNPRILNFRVDAPFDPEAGRRDRQQYVDNYGVRGQKLIEDLGNGKGPSDVPLRDKDMREVKFYYTYPGADQNEEYKYK